MSNLVRTALRPASLMLAAALCFSTVTHAADDGFISQASLSLNGLSFQLIDLTPDDGIAPSLSFQSQGFIDTRNMGYDEATDTYIHRGPQFENSLLPTAPLSYVSADGLSTVTTTSSSVSMQSQLPLSQLLPALTPPNAQGTDDVLYKSTASGTDLAVGSPYDSVFQQFTLSAGTGLVVRGALSGSVTIDSTALRAELDANGYTDWTLHSGQGPRAFFQMAAQVNDLFDATGYPIGLHLKQANSVDLNLWTYGVQGSFSDDNGSEGAFSKDFEFGLINIGDTDMTGVVVLNLEVGSDLSLYAYRPSAWTPPVDVPAIPEPSTYALMGLGLVGILGVTRHRGHAA